MTINYKIFHSVIERKYTELHDLCRSLSVYDRYGQWSDDIDDIFERNLFPEIKVLYDEVEIYYNDKFRNELSILGYKVLWIKILEWLRDNPTRIEWALL